MSKDKCPKCGRIGTTNVGFRDECLRNQLTAANERANEADYAFRASDENRAVQCRRAEKAERERDEAQAACAAGRGVLQELVYILEGEHLDEIDSFTAQPARIYLAQPNPGKPILDRMANAEAENADLRTCLSLVATGEIDLHVHQDGTWYYEMQACGLSEQGGMYDHPADAALAGLAELRKDKDHADTSR